MSTYPLQQVVNDIAAQPKELDQLNDIARLSALEVQLRNFYLYTGGLKNNADFDAGYCKGKRDAFLQILHFLEGSDNLQERIDELEEILVGSCQ